MMRVDATSLGVSVSAAALAAFVAFIADRPTGGTVQQQKLYANMERFQGLTPAAPIFTSTDVARAHPEVVLAERQD